MPNANYKKGYNKERMLVNRAREAGRVAFRSAGSHSPIDVITINHEDRKIQLLQSKPDTMSQNAKNKILEDNKFLNGTYEVSFHVV